MEVNDDDFERNNANSDESAPLTARSTNSLAFSDTNFEIINATSPMYQSTSSVASLDDPWKASTIGIKCVSYKPAGYVYLTRRILDLCSTDGKRKIEILYNYSKNFNKLKIPTIGTSIQNCTFCDTISLDFDPESTLFDLVMEVQIITQGPELNRPSAQIENSSALSSEIAIDTGQSGSDSDNEESLVTSVYNLKYQSYAQETQTSSQISDFGKLSTDFGKSLIEPNDYENNDVQKIIIRTIIKSDSDNQTLNLSGSKSTDSVITSDYCRSTSDLNDRCLSSDLRSVSTSSLFSSLSDGNSVHSADKSRMTSSLHSSANSRNSSKRSIYTTVEFYPPGENHVEFFDVSNEDVENHNFIESLDLDTSLIKTSLKAVDVPKIELNEHKFLNESRPNIFENISSDRTEPQTFDNNENKNEIISSSTLSLENVNNLSQLQQYNSYTNNNNSEQTEIILVKETDEHLAINNINDDFNKIEARNYVKHRSTEFENNLFDRISTTSTQNLEIDNNSNYLLHKDLIEIVQESLNQSNKNNNNSNGKNKFYSLCDLSEFSMNNDNNKNNGISFSNETLKSVNSINESENDKENILHLIRKELSLDESQLNRNLYLNLKLDLDKCSLDSDDSCLDSDRNSSNDSIVTVIDNKSYKSKSDFHQRTEIESHGQLDLVTKIEQSLSKHVNVEELSSKTENKYNFLDKNKTHNHVPNTSNLNKNIISHTPIDEFMNDNISVLNLTSIEPSEELQSNNEIEFYTVKVKNNSQSDNNLINGDFTENSIPSLGTKIQSMDEENIRVGDIKLIQDIKDKFEIEIINSDMTTLNESNINTNTELYFTKSVSIVKENYLQNLPEKTINVNKISLETEFETNEETSGDYVLETIGNSKSNSNQILLNQKEVNNNNKYFADRNDNDANLKEEGRYQIKINFETNNENKDTLSKEIVITNENENEIEASESNLNQRDNAQNILDFGNLDIKLNDTNLLRHLKNKNSPLQNRGEISSSSKVSSKIVKSNNNIERIPIVTRQQLKIDKVDHESSESDNDSTSSESELLNQDNNQSKSTSSSWNIFSIFFKSNDAKLKTQSTQNSNLACFTTNQTESNKLVNEIDINMLDLSKYELVLKKQIVPEFSNYLTPSNDCAYFPNYKLNDEIVDYVPLSDETIEKRKIKNISELAVFDLYTEWDTSFTSGYNSINIDKSLDVYEPNDIKSDSLQAPRDLFELTPFVGKTENNSPSIMSRLFSRFTRIKKNDAKLESFRTNRANSISEPNNLKELMPLKRHSKSYSDGEAVVINDNLKYLSLQSDLIIQNFVENFMQKFKISEFSSINTLFQEGFYRAPFKNDKQLGLSFNRLESLPSPIDAQTQFAWIDIARCQSLVQVKPYFDDFGIFQKQNYEISNYFLIVNSNKYDFFHSAQRSGKPFFYVNDADRLIQICDKSFSPQNFFGFFVITIGALSLFSFSFV